jgi:hypothetical protein
MQQGWATSHDKNQSQRAVGRRISTMGSAATLLDVVNFDNLRFNIGLTATQMNDLAAFPQTLRRPKLDMVRAVAHQIGRQVQKWMGGSFLERESAACAAIASRG